MTPESIEIWTRIIAEVAIILGSLGVVEFWRRPRV